MSCRGRRAQLCIEMLQRAAVLWVTAGLLLASGGCHRAPRAAHVPLRLLPADPRAAVTHVALGDSTVAGVGATSPERTYVHHLFARLRTVYPRARLVNLGVSGATAADVVVGQLPAALQQAPTLVTLSIGPNDLLAQREVAAFARDLDTILRTLGTATAAVLVVNLLPDLTVTPRFRAHPDAAILGQRLAAFNDVLRQNARVYGAVVVDLYTPSRAEVPRRPELVAADGYHPSDRGYERWAELMWKGIAQRLPVAARADGAPTLRGWRE